MSYCNHGSSKRARGTALQARNSCTLPGGPKSATRKLGSTGPVSFRLPETNHQLRSQRMFSLSSPLVFAAGTGHSELGGPGVPGGPQ
jgi:hypothetical protein